MSPWQVSDGNKQLAVFFTVHLLGAILNGSLYAKEIFKETIGYDKLGELIDRLGSPSQELIETLMDMVCKNNTVQFLGHLQ